MTPDFEPIFINNSLLTFLNECFYNASILFLEIMGTAQIGIPDLFKLRSLTVCQQFSRMSILPVEIRDSFRQFFRCKNRRTLVRVNKMGKAHADIVDLSTFSAPVFVDIWHSRECSFHDDSVDTIACSYHEEIVANMNFLVIPYAPVIIKIFFIEIFHGIFKVCHCITADVSVPTHNESLAIVFYHYTLSLFKYLLPLFAWQGIKQGLLIVHPNEILIAFHLLIEI